ncbi:MAG: histone deacetylase family protein [Pseudomonadota bacterium]
MTTALITHSDCLEHVTPDGHPERVDRLRAVMAALEAEEFQHLVRLEASEATDVAINRAHAPGYAEALKARIPDRGASPIDADTWLSPGSWRSAVRAAGAVMDGVDLVLENKVGNVFCAVRPPGHHAEADRAMGFCLLNSAGIGALHAIESHGLSRVAIVDFDVHHGNGAQDIFERDGRVLYVSTHEWPLYPGTGAAHETGVGNVVNVCLPAFTDGAAYRPIFEAQVMPAVEAFRPELLIISAGFDGHRDDPLAQLMLTEDDFAWATQRLCEAATSLCDGRVVSTLEGGYDLASLARSAAAHVRVLMEQPSR